MLPTGIGAFGFLSLLLWEITYSHLKTCPDVFKEALWSEQSEKTHLCTASQLRRFHTGDSPLRGFQSPQEPRRINPVNRKVRPDGSQARPCGKTQKPQWEMGL